MVSYDVSHDKPSEHKNGALFVKKTQRPSGAQHKQGSI